MRNKKTLFIVGSGFHGKSIYCIAFESKAWDKIYFLDDSYTEKSKNKKFVKGKINKINKLIKNKNTYFIIGIGDNLIREKIFNRYFQKNRSKLISIIHPTASISQNVKIGVGSVIFANSVISNNSKLGICVIINNLSTIDHDAKISDFVHISPGVSIAGNVKIQELNWIGIGVNIINNINIGKSSIIGAGSIILSNIKPYSKIVGVHK